MAQQVKALALLQITAVVQVRSLAQERLYAMGAAKKNLSINFSKPKLLTFTYPSS